MAQKLKTYVGTITVQAVSQKAASKELARLWDRIVDENMNEPDAILDDGFICQRQAGQKKA